MVHLVLEIFSTFIFEGLCYGVGWGILNLVGVKRLSRMRRYVA